MTDITKTPFSLSASLFIFLVALSGCAGKQLKTEEVVVSGPVATGQLPVPVPTPSVAVSLQDVKTTEVSDPNGLERKDIEDIEKVSIHLAHADVVLTGNQPARKGKLSIKRLKGDHSCKAFLHETEDGIQISEASTPPPPAIAPPGAGSNLKVVKSAVPVLPNCQFGIELSLHEAATLFIELKRGNVFIENWEDPVDIRMEWGDVDVGTIGELNVACTRCTLTGENVSGPIRYTMETGNVGLAGLGGSVTGQTFGDTVLKWRKLQSDTQVNLVSHAGDVLLFFPPASPINADLSAPHGEVRNGKEAGEVKVQFRSSSGHGIPVIVTAEAGDVRLYRDSKAR